VPADTTAPVLLSSMPADGSSVQAPGDGIELMFSEPIDLARAQRGGVVLQTSGGQQIQSTIESHGSSIVVRPLQRLPYSTSFQILLTDVADSAGNALADTTPFTFATPTLQNTDVPLTVSAIHPGVPCALTGGDGTSPGRCAGGQGGDDLYHPFELPAEDPIEIELSQPATTQSVTLSTACGATGSVRVEELDGGGNCVAATPGTLVRRDRGLRFIPDAPWTVGTRYRLTLVSGGNDNCDLGELCGFNGNAASFDPLNGAGGGDAGGGNIVIDFTATEATKATYLFADAAPYSDVNGSGGLDGSEVTRDDNRAAMRITGTTGAISDANFQGADCLPGTPDTEACMYLQGAMPVQLGELQQNCALPDGTTAATCIPLLLAPQAMYGTSVTLHATAVIGITTDTGVAVMRIREPAGGPVMGFIVDNGGTPKMELALDLYMDAPDMSVALSDHDLHSKPLSVLLQGPVTFQPDGRIAISLANVADAPVEVHIDAPLGISGSVQMVVPANEMKLQLLSRPLRGAEP
jgi:hypothetical protein